LQNTFKFEEEMLKEVNDSVHTFFVEDPTVTNVLRRYETRSMEGMKTYGTSLRNNDANLEFWLESAIEEAMDHTLYLQRALEEVRKRG